MEYILRRVGDWDSGGMNTRRHHPREYVCTHAIEQFNVVSDIKKEEDYEEHRQPGE